MQNLRLKTVEEGVGILDSVASLVRNAVSSEPSPDSMMTRELNFDSDLGDESFPQPYAFTHMIQRGLVYAAGERIVTLTWCVRAEPYPHVMSANELARAAVEAASMGSWLGEAEADGQRRLRRMLGLVSYSRAQSSGLRHTLGLHPQRDEMEKALEWGHRREIRHERCPKYSDLLKRYNPQTGNADYRRLSEVAHGSVHGALGTWRHIVRAQEGNTDSLFIDVLFTASIACRYALGGAEAVLRMTGADRASPNRLRVRIRSFEDELARTARSAGWEVT